MTLVNLQVTDFRNFRSAELSLSPELNIIYGDNAAGKTSLLEAIYVLGRARSFRATTLQKLVNNKSYQFTIFGRLSEDINNTVPLGVGYKDKKLTAKYNTMDISRLSTLAKYFPIVALTGNLHQIIENGPKYRRQFMDWALFHVEPQYESCWKIYSRALKQRNAALKIGTRLSEVEVWENELAKFGEKIDSYRLGFIQSLTEVFSTIFGSLVNCNDEFILKYMYGHKKGFSLLETLKQDHTKDLKRGFTQAGPHRADITFITSKSEYYLSRGQQKLMIIALQLSHIVVARNLGIHIHFLLDDFGAELDKVHQKKVLMAVKATKAQCFITMLEKTQKDFPVDRLFHVKQNTVITL
ncbi:MAG: DNA replication/repair protein RecF [Gammaproteobacteria bacterium]